MLIFPLRQTVQIRFAFALSLLSCGSGSSSNAPAEAIDASAGPPVGLCDAITQQHPIEGYTHVPFCSKVTYQTNPPSSGNHYAIWAAYQTYTSPVPEGMWVHNLEHGCVVLTYNCPDGCAADIAAAQSMIESLADDPECTSLNEGVHRRIVMTPDPHLSARFAASAWGWTLRGNCFDTDAFGSFVRDHYGHGREDFCTNGEDPSLLGAPPTCGE